MSERIKFHNCFSSMNKEQIEMLNEDLILYYQGGTYEQEQFLVNGGLNG